MSVSYPHTGQSSTAKAIPDAVGAAAASGNPNLTAAEASDKNLDHNQERWGDISFCTCIFTT